DPRSIDVGEEFTETLLDLDEETAYHFVEASPADAEQGLADGSYGATVEIPSTFSSNIATLAAEGEEAEQAAPALLTVTTNDSINYVGGNFTKSVGTALTDSLRANVLEEYLDNVYVGFTTIQHGVVKEADGAGELADGTSGLKAGIAELGSGAEELHEGAGELASGTGALAVASWELSDGVWTLHEVSLVLVVGLRQLAAVAVERRDGTVTLSEGADALSEGLATLDEQGQPLRAGGGELADGAGQLASGATDLSDGAKQVAGGTAQLDETIRSAQERAEEIGGTPENVQALSDDLVTAIDL